MEKHMNDLQTFLSIAADANTRSWQAKAFRRSQNGSEQDAREASGFIQMIKVSRKDKEGNEKLVDAQITEVELLGIALSTALKLAEGWAGTCILEVDARLNGMLKVSLHDWERAGRLNDGESGFVYARDAWCEVVRALRQEPAQLRVYWAL
jgi:hypothetical protein